MHLSCLKFVSDSITLAEIAGKRVLEVGSQDFNGSPSYILRLLTPAEYIGVDIEKGENVDIICPSEKLVEKFGENSFDVVVSTEMLEHVLDWRIVISNLKRVLKPGGMLLLTTRSYGFKYHGYPYDFWRYEIGDFREIFSDMEIKYLSKDTERVGVFLKSVKPNDFHEKDLSEISLYSIVLGRRLKSIDLEDKEYKRKLNKIFKHKERKELKRKIKKSLRNVFKAKKHMVN